MSELWNHASEEERATLIGLFIERVDVVDKYYVSVALISDFNGDYDPLKTGARSTAPKDFSAIPLVATTSENQILEKEASFEGISPCGSMLNKFRGE